MRYGWATAQTNPATIVSGPLSWIASTRAGRRAVSLLVSSLGMLVAISELTRTSSRESLAEVRDPMQAQPQAQRREPASRVGGRCAEAATAGARGRAQQQAAARLRRCRTSCGD